MAASDFMGMSTSDGYSDDIARLDASTSPREFEAHFLRRNVPCILTGVGRDWLACKEWGCGGQAALDALAARFGDEEVSVHDCSSTVAGRFRISEMRLADLFALWSRGEGSSLYLKDWNLALNDSSTEYYVTPEHFSRDWLNGHAHSTEQASDHRFVYIGRGGTFTPLHKDVLCSYSWSFNVAGMKRWWLVRPEDEPLLRGLDGELAHDLRNIDTSVLPNWDENARARVLQVVQAPGEALFVPSCWVHQVLNEGGPTDTIISINHNWLNGFCAHRCWAFLQQQRAEIMRTVEGCADDEATTQEVLEFKFSFNYLTWYELLCCALEVAAVRAQSELREAAEMGEPSPSEKVRAQTDSVCAAIEELQSVLLHIELVAQTDGLEVAETGGVNTNAARRLLVECGDVLQRLHGLCRGSEDR